MSAFEALKGFAARRARSFGHALRGLRWVAEHERNGKYHIAHCLACLAASPVAGPLPLCFSLLALGSECVNSGIERAVDLGTRGRKSDLARISKDAASAAVLCFLLASLAVDLLALADIASRIGALAQALEN